MLSLVHRNDMKSKIDCLVLETLGLTQSGSSKYLDQAIGIDNMITCTYIMIECIKYALVRLNILSIQACNVKKI